MRTFWESRVKKIPDKVFIYYGDEKITYKQADEKINQTAHGLLKMGIKKGDKISVMLRNVPEFLYSWFAMAKLGGVVTTINMAFTPTEAQYVVNHSESIGLIIGQESIQVAQQIRKDCPHLKWVACIEEENLPSDIVPFSRLYRDAPTTLEDFHVTGDDPVCMIYTSGTTGFPKGCQHVQSNLVLTGEAFTVRAGINSEDRIMVILPLFHMNSLFYQVWGTIAAEASMILIQKFSASRFWEYAVKYGATEFNFIGAVGKILSVRDRKEFRPEHKIKTAIGAAVTPDVYKVFTEEFKIKNVIDAYGLSEIPAVCQNPIGGKVKVGSMGPPAKLPNGSALTEMKIVDDEGKELPVGEVGEIIARNAVQMKQYFKEPEKTAETIIDGWLYTGDLGRKDEDGYYWFVSRKKDIIRRGGENIAAAEIETAINTNPKVNESAAIAVPSELGEDEVMLCIVLNEGQSMTPEEAIEWLTPRLAAFKIPRYIQFRPSLPKTATERIAKGTLKQEKDLIKKSFDMAARKK
jgi:crotonobetaine/carnitine-CoA ligase